MCEICPQLHIEKVCFEIHAKEISIIFGNGWTYAELKEIVEHLQEIQYQCK